MRSVADTTAMSAHRRTRAVTNPDAFLDTTRTLARELAADWGIPHALDTLMAPYRDGALARHADAGHEQVAFDHYFEVLDVDTDTLEIPALIELADVAERAGARDTANRLYQAAVERGSIDAHASLALAAHDRGDDAAAASHLAVGVSINNPAARVAASRIAEDAGDTHNALRHLEGAADAGHVDAMIDLGVRYMWRNDPDRGLGWLRRAIETEQPRAFLEFANLVADQYRFSIAEEALRHVRGGPALAASTAVVRAGIHEHYGHLQDVAAESDSEVRDLIDGGRVGDIEALLSLAEAAARARRPDLAVRRATEAVTQDIASHDQRKRAGALKAAAAERLADPDSPHVFRHDTGGRAPAVAAALQMLYAGG